MSMEMHKMSQHLASTSDGDFQLNELNKVHLPRLESYNMQEIRRFPGVREIARRMRRELKRKRKDAEEALRLETIEMLRVRSWLDVKKITPSDATSPSCTVTSETPTSSLEERLALVKKQSASGIRILNEEMWIEIERKRKEYKARYKFMEDF